MVINPDLISHMKQLYSIEPFADLSFDLDEMSAYKERYGGKWYLNFNASVDNTGIIDAEEVFLKVYADGSELESFDLEMIPFGGGEVVFIMAPGDNSKDKPDTDKLRAFLLDGRLGVSLNKGTWHWPPLAIREFANIFLLLKGEVPYKKTDYANIGFNVYAVL